MTVDKGLLRELTRHDELLASLGLQLWMGGEPTFTDRHSYEPEWTWAALGSAKFSRAAGLAAALVREVPGAMLLRTIGRQYPEEACARWSFGCYALRDGTEVVSGFADPLLAGFPSGIPDAHAFAYAMLGNLRWTGMAGTSVALEGGIEDAEEARIVVTRGTLEGVSPVTHPALLRTCLHAGEIPAAGPIDELSQIGLLLFVVRVHREEAGSCLRLELPAIASHTEFLEVLQAIENATRQCGISSMILEGFGPPSDANVYWTTITPDPGVVEINMAPSHTTVAFWHEHRRVYRLAQAADLSPSRMHYNGEQNDSGGGGHLTLGGPTPQDSIFLTNHRLLPRLIAFFVRHPSLSYLFNENAGPSSQSPRADESTRDYFHELQVSLNLLNRASEVDGETLWRSLSNFLVDRTGNSHRCEINIEKLANPWLPGRGRLGLVEFRALRMPEQPERWAALAVLWRSIVALCSLRDTGVVLRDWGDELHDRFALPYWLDADLRDVLRELAAAGFPVGEALAKQLLDDRHRHVASVELDGSTLEIRRAFEFWPLVGDAATQGGTSRLVDPSCVRLEFRIVETRAQNGSPWHLALDGYRVPLGLGPLDPRGVRSSVIGLRYQTFRPMLGVHPLLNPREPLSLMLRNAKGQAWQVILSGWRNDGEAYEGLPADANDAARRRSQRVEVLALAKESVPPALQDFPAHARTPWCIDTRAL